MIEGQVDYTLQCIAQMVREGGTALDVREAAMERSLERLDHELESTVWAGNCGSWYKTSEGVITNNWSSFATSYRNRVRHPDFDDFRRVQAATSSNTRMLPE